MAVPVTLTTPGGDRIRASAWQADGLWVISAHGLPRAFSNPRALFPGYWEEAGWSIEPPLDSILAPQKETA